MLIDIHRQMAKRYNNCDFPIDRIDNMIVYSHVAVKMEDQNGYRQWCRGEIRSVDKANEVAEVFAVDYGSKKMVPFRFIRRLDSEFTDVLPMQAFGCRLANVDYGRGHKLGSHVVSFIGDMMQKENTSQILQTLQALNNIDSQ